MLKNNILPLEHFRMKISVIVITYNQEPLIGRTLDAILKQECSEDFEVIIGEDCSTDNTLDVCRRYAERYPNIIRLIANERNLGIVDNYYNCVRQARGEYMIDCGGDDEWMPGRMQLFLNIMEAHPDVSMSLSPYIARDSKTGELTPYSFSTWTPGIYDGNVLTYGFVGAMEHPPGVMGMMRMSAIREAMSKWPRFFCGREYQMEDVQLYATMGQLGKVYYTDQPTFYYTTGHNSISQRRDLFKYYSFQSNALQLKLHLITDLHLDKTALQPALQFWINILLRQAFKLKRTDLRHEVLHMAKANGIGQSRWDLLILKFITCNRFTWALAHRLAIR